MTNEKEGPLITRWNLVPKGLFICMSLAYYCVYTFRDHFLEYFLGLNNKVGWFGAVIALATFSGGLFWAKTTDLTGDYTTPLILCAWLSCVSFYGMYFLKFGANSTFYIALVCFGFNGFFLSAFQPLIDSLVLRIIPIRILTANKDCGSLSLMELFLLLWYTCAIEWAGLLYFQQCHC